VLKRLEIAQLRNIEKVELEPAAHLNCLVGANGSGKTSVLEAIHLVGRGRSFKTTRASELIRFDQVQATVSARLGDKGATAFPVGVRVARGEREIRIRGQRAASSAELLVIFPLLLIQPSSVELVEGAPRLRRQFLDWGAFHVEHAYLDVWRRHVKALSQRNAALRSGADLEPWDQALARYGTILAEARAQYVLRLQPTIKAAVSHFLPGVDVVLKVATGWADARPLLDVLREERDRDRQFGYTQSGAHKADFVLAANGRAARRFLSRGQTKMLAYALLLAQAGFLAEAAGPACVMIDDLPSELDPVNRGRLWDYLASLRAQCFITAVDRQELDAARAEDIAMFHVEHGRVIPR
jgi:DNA replication and repair protein RecF